MRIFSILLALLPAAAFAVGELPEGATVVVPPLLRAEWNQGRHYNLMCPYAPGYNCPDDRMYAGCVAVAAGMILDYYRWPVQGNTVGLNLENEKYWTKSDICLRARFDEPYDWEAIRESYGHVVSARSSLAVGRLLSDVGAVLEMTYGTSGSSSLTEKIPSVLHNNFRFSDAGSVVADYPYDADELAAISAQLSAGHPIACSGPAGAEGKGHSYVCDGLATCADGSELYHFNFGWGGKGNGWYPLDGVVTQATASDTPKAWPVEDMFLGVLPEKSAQFLPAPAVSGRDVSLAWDYADCWTGGLVGQTLERQIREEVSVSRRFSASDWWVREDGGFGWSLENGAPVAKMDGSFFGPQWPGWGSATIALSTPLTISSDTTLTIAYSARRFPNGVTLTLVPCVPDEQLGGYTIYPNGSSNEFPAFKSVPGGTSTTAMTDRTLTVTGAELVAAFGANATDARFALLFTDKVGDSTYSAGTEVFRIKSVSLNGRALDWGTVETKALDGAVRSAEFSALEEGDYRFLLAGTYADGSVATTIVERCVSSSVSEPSVAVVGETANTVIFEVTGTDGFSYAFEKQSNALWGSGSRSGNRITYTFENAIAGLGTHWLTLSVTDTASGVKTTATYITNPPVDHPLSDSFEPDFNQALSRAKREGKLVFLLASGEPDGLKFKNVAGLLSSNEVLRAVADRFIYTEALTTTVSGNEIARKYWRAQPTSPSDSTSGTFKPDITAYAIVIDPTRSEAPYPCDELPASYFNASSRWNYFNSQFDLDNLGYSFYVAQRTTELVRFLNQEGFVVSVGLVTAGGETVFDAQDGSGPVAVPHDWLMSVGLAAAGDSTNGIASALSAVYANGHTGWNSFVAGLDPRRTDGVLTANITMIDGTPVITWSPDLRGTAENALRPRIYTVEGKSVLDGTWHPTSAGDRFFRVTVRLQPSVAK